MGNCVRRETGIETETKDKINTEEMILNIV